MNGVLASAHLTASSAGNGLLVVIAFIVFLVAAVLAWLPPRAYWASAVAAGLALFMLALLLGP